MKRLLCTYTTGEEALLCRAYFVSDSHRNQTWDGIGALDIDLSRLLQNAVDYIRSVNIEVSRVRELRLCALPAMGYEHYYFVTVDFSLSDGVSTHEVILDLDGQVIAPEMRRFEDRDELYRYLASIQA